MQVKPCPCCGSKDLWVGVLSCSSYGVECRDCRLEMSKSFPYKWPKGVWKRKLSGDENYARLIEFVLAQAVEKWNTRVATDVHVEFEPHLPER